MKPGRTLPGTIIAQIVLVHAVNDVRDAPFRADLLQNGEQLVFAMEAAIGIVLHVVRILKLVRLDILVPDSKLAGEGLGVKLVRFRNGSRIPP